MRTQTLFVTLVLLLITSCNKQITEIYPPPVQNLEIPNGDFEIWNSRPCIVLWTTNSIPERLPPWDPYIIKQDTDAFHGKYAPRFIYNGVERATAEIKIPSELHPVSLTAYVKSKMISDDSVFVGIYLYKGSVIADSGIWWGINSIPSYQKLTVPITNGSSASDTVSIRIMGGNKGSRLDTNSVFWIDYLSFNFK